MKSPGTSVGRGYIRLYTLYPLLICLYAVLIGFVNLCCFVSSLFPGRERRSPRIHRIVVCSAKIFRRSVEITGIGIIKFQGFDLLPKQPSILIANHTGLLDAILLISVLTDVAVVFKKGLRFSPFYSHLTSEPGYIGNDEGIGLIKQSCEALSSGRRILIFPEGTRTEAVPINPLKGGFAVIARQMNIPIYTILIDNKSWFLGKGGGLFQNYKFPFVCEFRVGKSFKPSAAQSSRELTTQVEQYLREALKDIEEAPWRMSSVKKS
ncbi:lysophospholipid acyltransferase family protein [Rubellicoccus peritrichatus]|uniref:Lysophospholipid acyltransferase family protein n=1 Tax=Rubellicoccus peritrichatus TaxID=3080537 RepID=A0AAQ3LBF4_9BACT|nr:lysophospholipid acyltransferase family protein [Puniceicoccus sp. CR14]WOO42326.1 lysophospholipid acyltransferase family protein [Puniceicoccus sp. CR14]